MQHQARLTTDPLREGGADEHDPYSSAYIVEQSQSSECQSFIDPPHPESTLFSALRTGGLTHLTAARLNDASLQLILPGK